MKARLITGEEIWYPGQQESLCPDLHWFAIGHDSCNCAVCGLLFEDGYHHMIDYVDDKK